MIVLSDLAYRELSQQKDANGANFENNPNIVGDARTMFGIAVRSSPIFPYDQPCKHCWGLGGGGAESTYCMECGGAGKRQIIGVMQQGGQMVILANSYPPAFAPEWPCEIGVPLRLIPNRPDFPVEGAFQ